MAQTLPQPVQEGSARPQFNYFLDLPTEIRIIIYDMVIRPGAHAIRPLLSPVWPDRVRKLDLGLLGVSKKVTAEAAERFYGRNTFSFNALFERHLKWIEQWFQKIGQNARYIQTINYLLLTSICQSEECTLAGLRLIHDFVPNLRRLTMTYLSPIPLYGAHRWPPESCTIGYNKNTWMALRPDVLEPKTVVRASPLVA
ncbi:hypothetical protein VTJ04DRAFT_5982 [Mycothermus thermophilus]|uniref:uncharacterized protein n=1 Tax=Humicola insolens TaxID=85995 RepID=UPI003744AEDC